MKSKILSAIAFAAILCSCLCRSSVMLSENTAPDQTLNDKVIVKETLTLIPTHTDSVSESEHSTSDIPADETISLLFSATEDSVIYLSASTENTAPADISPSEDTQLTEPISGSAEASSPETNIPETTLRQTKAPETEAPETKAPETKAPETKAPETKAPETKAPETEAPTTSAPEFEMTQAPVIKDDSFGDLFLDALAYTGYDVKSQLSSGKLFKKYGSSTPSSVLSNIGYSIHLTGRETVSDSSSATGMAPDIALFERYGLCCASYVTYVYYNYLPNIAGINTSGIPCPSSCRSSVAYESAAEKWVKDGKAEKIDFTRNGGYITPAENIPTGALVVFKSTETGKTAHVALYAGYSNGKHFISHVGNSRGPEVISIDAMYRGSEPELVSGIYVPYFCR